ncbi:hypothetical protein AB4Z01_31390 [Inquilinus sp. YAF38]|uniref:DUF7832 domain-containing protein n=1 Tax=Inquilinus sp. YAF38 TaxID=3233084 RepID=UPI003F8E71E1
MKYDDASWHYGGTFPDNFPNSAGATHIAMFLTWAALNDLVGELHHTELQTDLARLKARSITPTEWFLSACDEKLTDEDFNDEGNKFASYYYDETTDPSGLTHYFADLFKTFPNVESLYSVPDSWASFDQLAPVIDRRFAAWRSKVG